MEKPEVLNKVLGYVRLVEYKGLKDCFATVGSKKNTIQLIINFSKNQYKIINRRTLERLPRKGRIDKELSDIVTNYIYPLDQSLVYNEFHRIICHEGEFKSVTNGTPIRIYTKQFGDLQSYRFYMAKSSFSKFLSQKAMVLLLKEEESYSNQKEIGNYVRNRLSIESYDNVFCVDLSNNTIRVLDNERLSLFAFMTMKYSDECIYIKNKYVYPEDREVFFQLFDYETLQRAYQKREKEINLEIRVLIGGIYVWYLVTSRFIYDESIKEKTCIITFKNINASMHKKNVLITKAERMSRILQSLYNASLAVDLKSDCIILEKVNKETNMYHRKDNTFSSWVNYISETYISEEDKLRFQLFFSLYELTQVMKKKEKAEIVVRVVTTEPLNECYYSRFIILKESENAQSLLVNILLEEHYEGVLTGYIKEEDRTSQLIFDYCDIAYRYHISIDKIELIKSTIYEESKASKYEEFIADLMNQLIHPEDITYVKEIFDQYAYSKTVDIHKSVDTLCRYKLKAGNVYRYVIASCIEVENVCAGVQNLYFIFKDVNHIVDSKKYFYNQSTIGRSIIRQLKVIIVAVDMETSNYEIMNQIQLKEANRVGKFKDLAEEWIQCGIRLHNQSWIEQYQSLEYIYNEVKNKPKEISVQIQKNMQYIWYRIVFMRYENISRKESILVLVHECTKSKENDQSILHNELKLRDMFYHDKISSIQERFNYLINNVNVILFEQNFDKKTYYVSDYWTKEFGFVFDKQDIFMYFLNNTNISDSDRIKLEDMSRDVYQCEDISITCTLQDANKTFHEYCISTHSSIDEKGMTRKIIGLIYRKA